MRFADMHSGRSGLCLAIWLCAALGSPALGGALSSEFAYLMDRRNFLRSTYHIRVPDIAGPNDRIPAVVILHDAGMSGAAIVNDERLIEAFVGKGYAVIAPDALPRRNARINYRGDRPGLVRSEAFTLPFSYSRKKFPLMGSDGVVGVLKYKTDAGWYFYNVDRVRFSSGQPRFERLGRDEIENLHTVLRNAAEEYGIDPKPVLVIGLGHGGSLVWQIACHAPNFSRILAPVGGAFWRNIPTNCQPGAHLVHTHHRASAFWPLAGTRGRKRRYARTSIYRNLEMLIVKNRCGPGKTTVRNDAFGVNHTIWADCPDGGPVGFMVLDKAFAFQTWWLDEMLGRIERTGIGRPPEAPEAPEETDPVVRAPGAGTGFKTPGAGTGFKTPGTETRSQFKRAK